MGFLSSRTFKTFFVVFSFFAGFELIRMTSEGFSSKDSKFLSEFSLEIQEFEDFLLKHGKSCSSPSEYQHRLQIFRDNLAFIKGFNKQGENVVLGVTQFADLTLNEFQALRNPVNVEETFLESEENFELPASVNWVAKGAVTPVNNQGQCGGASVFAGVASIESAWFIAGHSLVSLSYQQVIDCDGKGCTGTSLPDVYNYVAQNGITSNSIYPFNGGSGTCNKSKASQTIVKISSYSSVTSSNLLALQTSVTQQPVSTYVDASSSIWQLYSGGTISSNCGTSLDHAVLIVGYQTQASPPYWTVKNSWGSSWGLSGYAQIAMSSGSGVCGINMMPFYPVI
jgi:C1A family cysteine protease